MMTSWGLAGPSSARAEVQRLSVQSNLPKITLIVCLIEQAAMTSKIDVKNMKKNCSKSFPFTTIHSICIEDM